jgi:hypothetical protein
MPCSVYLLIVAVAGAGAGACAGAADDIIPVACWCH